MISPKLTLWVDGHIHHGWTAAGVTLGLTQLSNAFTLTVTDKWYDSNGAPTRLDIAPGSACRLEIAGQRLITGYVDQVTPSYSASAHSIAVTGRDTAGDLVDCSAEIAEWRGQKLETIIRALISPYGMRLTVQAGVDSGEAFGRFAVNAGDSVQQTLERLTRQRALLLWSDGLGGLILGRGTVGAPLATLARGQRILSANATNTHADRFSQITVMQSQEAPADGADAATVTQSLGIAYDPDISRYRPLILVPEAPATTLTMGERAEWERRVRTGKGHKFTLSVQGWFADTAQTTLWRPGQTVTFNDDWLGAAGTYLISAVSLNLSTSGSIAGLTLLPPGALDRLVEPDGPAKPKPQAQAQAQAPASEPQKAVS
jgi:prophage tail gpP-like protein